MSDNFKKVNFLPQCLMQLQLTIFKHCHKNGGIHIIASNKDHNFEYNGFCKITINHVSSMLSVKPINEEFKLISAMFQWKFYAQKNILFVFAENKFQDFILVFNNEIKCKKVYDLIYRKKAKNEITNELIYNRILFPILNQITKVSNIVISQLLLKWINKLKKNDKAMYIKMMKDDNIFDLVNLKNKFIAEMNIDGKDEMKAKVERKRKFGKLNTSNNSKDVKIFENLRAKKQHANLSSNCFVKSNTEFKIVNIKGKKNILKRLLLFPFRNRNYCYEYFQNPKKAKFYICVECRKIGINTYAKMDQNKNLLLHEKKHVCKKLQYSAEKYFNPQIFKKSNYEILENCSTKTGKVLIIFDPNNRSQCHEFRWRNSDKSFRCSKCNVIAKIYSASKENEYVEILNLSHGCEYCEYNPEQYFKFKNFVLSPNFEIQTEMKNGKERKTLFIFDENDKTKCYIYYFHHFHKLFNCKKCFKQKIIVSAKLHENSDGENYVILSNKEHICESVKYVPFKNDNDIILRSPIIKVMEETSTGVGKVFIFDSKNKDLCYVFSQITTNRYRCHGCKNIVYKKCKNNVDKTNVIDGLYLCKDENGEYFVKIKKGQKHLCQPRKYEPDKYEPKESFKTDKYFYYRNKKYPKSINVSIIYSTDKTLCYPFSYLKSTNYFQCLNCMKLKRYCYISPPKKDENGKEYFIHDLKKHICKPIKISSIQTPQFQKLQRKDIAFNEKQKINENRILKLPHFELRTSQRGVPEEKLVVFDSKDRSMCFEYYYDTNQKLFICLKCGDKKHRVTAKVHVDEESNEKFIEISEKQHICEPIKDEYNDKIIYSSMFIVMNEDDGMKPKRIILFTSETKEFYFEFYYNSEKKMFQCLSCKRLKKFVCVKLCKKEDGEEYLMKMKNEHICTQKKYDQRNFEKPKTVPESMFELFRNIKGEENKKLIIFASENRDFVYEYYLSNPSFVCCTA